MVRQIVIESEPPGDTQPTFRLSIDANVIAKGVTVAQAYYLVGEVLGQFLPPRHAESVTFDSDGVERENVGVAKLAYSLPPMVSSA
jgi:hypothetical protein